VITINNSFDSSASISQKKVTTRKERLLPVFVMEILKAHSSSTHHCSQAFIKEKLQNAPYSIYVNRKTVSNCIKALLDEDLFIFGDTRSCWYDRKGYCPE